MNELLTVKQVAQVLKCSEDSVTRRFADVPGVVHLGSLEKRNKRKYRIMRIPRAVLEKYLAGASGKLVNIEIPPDAPQRRRMAHGEWMDRAVLQLADLGKRNGCTDAKDYARIASRARLLAASVPEKYWSEICSDGAVWSDGDED